MLHYRFYVQNIFLRGKKLRFLITNLRFKVLRNVNNKINMYIMYKIRTFQLSTQDYCFFAPVFFPAEQCHHHHCYLPLSLDQEWKIIVWEYNLINHLKLWTQWVFVPLNYKFWLSVKTPDRHRDTVGLLCDQWVISKAHWIIRSWTSRQEIFTFTASVE